MKENVYPEGWDEERVRLVIERYEAQSDEEAAAEDDRIYGLAGHMVMSVPVELVPAVRELIAKYESRRSRASQKCAPIPTAAAWA